MNLVSDIVDLHFRVRENDLLEIVLEQVVIQEVEVTSDHHVVEQFSLVHCRTLLESQKVLLLVCQGNFFHCLNMTSLILKGDGRIDESK